MVWLELEAQGNSEEHEVLELDSSAYALFTASPLVCQQSFLTWLEQAEEGTPEAPIDEPDSGARMVDQSLGVLGRALDLPIEGARLGSRS